MKITKVLPFVCLWISAVKFLFKSSIVQMHLIIRTNLIFFWNFRFIKNILNFRWFQNIDTTCITYYTILNSDWHRTRYIHLYIWMYVVLWSSTPYGIIRTFFYMVYSTRNPIKIPFINLIFSKLYPEMWVTWSHISSSM